MGSQLRTEEDVRGRRLCHDSWKHFSFLPPTLFQEPPRPQQGLWTLCCNTSGYHYVRPAIPQDTLRLASSYFPPLQSFSTLLPPKVTILSDGCPKLGFMQIWGVSCVHQIGNGRSAQSFCARSLFAPPWRVRVVDVRTQMLVFPRFWGAVEVFDPGCPHKWPSDVHNISVPKAFSFGLLFFPDQRSWQAPDAPSKRITAKCTIKTYSFDLIKEVKSRTTPA